MSLRSNPNVLASDNCCHRLQSCASYLRCCFCSCNILYKTYKRELLIDTYTWYMLPKSVKCPRCPKRGFLTLRWVRSSRYGRGEAPNQISHWIDMPLLNSLAGNGQTKRTITKRKRNLLRYAPNWYLYIGHYDSKKYRSAMERYKKGILSHAPMGVVGIKYAINELKDNCNPI
jgi:hypothetical protein